jgi:hypothetical protein
MSNLRLIKEVEVTSSVAYVDVTDVFSSDFNIYNVVTTDFAVAGVAATDAWCKLINSSGSVVTTTLYDRGGLSMTDYTAYVEENGINGNYFPEFFGLFYPSVNNASSSSSSFFINPYENNSWTYILNENTSGDTSTFRHKHQGAFLRELSSITGFRVEVQVAARPFDQGKIQVYGVRVD